MDFINALIFSEGGMTRPHLSRLLTLAHVPFQWQPNPVLHSIIMLVD